jgi:hypothetical protein
MVRISTLGAKMNWVEVERIPLDPKKRYAVQMRKDSEQGDVILVVEFNEKENNWVSCCLCDEFDAIDIARYLELPEIEVTSGIVPQSSIPLDDTL